MYYFSDNVMRCLILSGVKRHFVPLVICMPKINGFVVCYVTSEFVCVYAHVRCHVSGVLLHLWFSPLFEAVDILKNCAKAGALVHFILSPYSYWDNIFLSLFFK